MMTVLQNIWLMILLTSVGVLVLMYIYAWIEEKIKKFLNKRKPD